jgi:hypothetical protein
LAFGTVLTQHGIRSLKYTNVGKKNIKGKPIHIWIKNIAFFFAHLLICDLRTGMGHQGTLQICDLWIYHNKFPDL